MHFHGTTDGLATGWAAGCATGLALAIGSDLAGRLGVCEAERCDRVYVDTSKNGSAPVLLDHLPEPHQGGGVPQRRVSVATPGAIRGPARAGSVRAIARPIADARGVVEQLVALGPVGEAVHGQGVGRCRAAATPPS